jgi:hypothetical protein
MERELLSAIQAKLGTDVPEVLFIHMWNNQHERLKEDNEEGISTYLFPLPATLIEFVGPMEIQQLGNGVQLYDPLIIRIHLLHNMLDAGDGTMEQNLLVFDIKNKVYKSLQAFEPTGAVAFVRVFEEQDYDHPNLYHFIIDFQTNFVDSATIKPVDGVDSTSPIPPVITSDLIIDNFNVRTAGIIP